MTISSIGRRVALVGSLAMLVALLPLAASAQPTGPVLRDLQVNDELEASESVQASILWSQEAFADDSADEVLIATDADFADALASGVLQGDAPLLYTDGDSVDDLVLEEIERLGATSATILGGEVAVSSDVEDALTDAGLEVSRLEGESRIETAVAIAEQELEGDTVFLARAFGTETDPTQAFADNLALGGWAADSGIPVLLAQTDVLTGNTRAFLEANTDVTNVTVVGGEAAISEDVVAELEELGLTVERVEGENRFGTAVAIAEARGLAAADVDQAVFVEGQADDAYINGLAAAAYSAANDAPILLTNGDAVPPETQDYLGDEADFSITDAAGETAGVLGTNVSADAAQALADALGAELETVQLASPEEPAAPNEGIVVDFDNVADTYEFVNDDDEVVEVEYDEDEDSFLVDGVAASAGIFEAELSTGDYIVYTPGEGDEGATHELENRDADFYTSGVVGNVDTTVPEFDIIEPVTGTPLNPNINYAGALYTVDGSPATVNTFNGDINEGDTVQIIEGDPNPDTFALQNEVVSGLAGNVNTVGAPPVTLTIGIYGDDPASAQDTDFVADDTNNHVYAGDVSDYAEFEAQVSDGDEISYSREGGVETFTLGNLAPEPVSGTVTEEYTGNDGAGAMDVVYATPGGRDSFTYTAGAQFIVDGILLTQGQFEQALSAGDAVTYREANAETNTTERVTLVNQPLVGTLDDLDAALDTVDVVNEGLVYDDLSYAAASNPFYRLVDQPNRYFVDGTEVTDTDFAAAIEAADLSDDAELEVIASPLADEFHLTTEPAAEA